MDYSPQLLVKHGIFTADDVSFINRCIKAQRIGFAYQLAFVRITRRLLFLETLLNIIIERPEPTKKNKQNLCADKAYDSTENRLMADLLDYVEHIKSRWEEKNLKKNNARYRARRWVVERTHSWLNRFRRLLIRWEKKAENYVAMLHLAFAYITLNAAEVLG